MTDDEIANMAYVDILLTMGDAHPPPSTPSRTFATTPGEEFENWSMAERAAAVAEADAIRARINAWLVANNIEPAE